MILINLFINFRNNKKNIYYFIDVILIIFIFVLICKYFEINFIAPLIFSLIKYKQIFSLFQTCAI